MDDIITGDCLEVLRGIDSCSIDACVTDPPAGIAFMGKAWDGSKGGRDQWIAWLASVMAEVLRALKPGGHAVVWALPRTSHWTGMALETAGFEIRDCLSHLFGSGFPKSLDVSKSIDRAAGAERDGVGDYGSSLVTAPATDDAKRWDGWGTALKPAAEMWWLVRKPSAPGSLCDTIDKTIEELCTEIAKHAGRPSEPFPAESNAEMADGAPKAATPKAGSAPKTQGGRVGAERDPTGTSSSTLTARKFLSIARSWQGTLAGICETVNACTIETGSALTTELKTLRSCLRQITRDSIRPDGLRLNGIDSTAATVAHLLSALGQRCDAIRVLSVPALAQTRAQPRIGGRWVARLAN